ncbi:MAG: hypothetical protein DRI32_09575, partial [Chloroflexi bacterium]
MNKKNKAERAKILNIVRPEFEIKRGWPSPFGANILRGGINFAVYSPHAQSVAL